jgi:TetR/AcrR family transcriptional repressor of nem operon
LGVSREKAAENRRAIVAAASQLFRERGVDAVGLNELMKQAGFTQGGFYNHFESKAALVAEVLASAMVQGTLSPDLLATLPVWAPEHSRISPAVWMIRLRSWPG